MITFVRVTSRQYEEGRSVTLCTRNPAYAGISITANKIKNIVLNPNMNKSNAFKRSVVSFFLMKPPCIDFNDSSGRTIDERSVTARGYACNY